MNERIRELAAIARGQAIVGTTVDEEQWKQHEQFVEKFAELIVRDCYVALFPALRDMISRGQAYDMIRQHFGVEERKGWVCPKCGADRTKIACPLGFGASVDGRCPMIATAQTGVE